MLATTLPIAELRGLGVKVTTVHYDHEPRRGKFHYSLRMPDSVGDVREGYDGRINLTPGTYVEVANYSDGHHIIVKGDDEGDTAALLIMIRDTLTETAS